MSESDELTRKILRRNTEIEAQTTNYNSFIRISKISKNNKAFVQTSLCIKCDMPIGKMRKIFNFHGICPAITPARSHWMHLECALSLQPFTCPRCADLQPLPFKTDAIQRLIDPKELSDKFEKYNLSHFSVDFLYKCGSILVMESIKNGHKQAFPRLTAFLEALENGVPGFLVLLLRLLKKTVVVKQELFLCNWIVSNKPKWIFGIAKTLLGASFMNWTQKSSLICRLPAYDKVLPQNGAGMNSNLEIAGYWVCCGTVFYYRSSKEKLENLIRRYQEQFGVLDDFASKNSGLQETTLLFLELCVKVRNTKFFCSNAHFGWWEKIPEERLVFLIRMFPKNESVTQEIIFCMLFEKLMDQNRKLNLYMEYFAKITTIVDEEIEFIATNFMKNGQAAILNEIAALPSKLEVAKAIVPIIDDPIYLIYPLTRLLSRNCADADVVQLYLRHLRSLGHGVLTPLLEGLLIGRQFEAASAILQKLDASEFCAGVLVGLSAFEMAPLGLKFEIFSKLDYSSAADSHIFCKYFLAQTAVKKEASYQFVCDSSIENEERLGPLMCFVKRLQRSDLYVILGRALADGNLWLSLKVYEILNAKSEANEQYDPALQSAGFSRNSNKNSHWSLM